MTLAAGQTYLNRYGVLPGESVLICGSHDGIYHTAADYAAAECEEHLAAFTDVYDSLGSGSIGTDRLIKREKEYPIFSDMNYRFFIS